MMHDLHPSIVSVKPTENRRPSSGLLSYVIGPFLGKILGERPTYRQSRATCVPQSNCTKEHHDPGGGNQLCRTSPLTGIPAACLRGFQRADSHALEISFLSQPVLSQNNLLGTFEDIEPGDRSLTHERVAMSITTNAMTRRDFLSNPRPTYPLRSTLAARSYMRSSTSSL